MPDEPGNGNPPAWAAQLEGDLQNNETLTQFGSISELGKSFLDLHGKSQNAVQIPGDDAAEEEWATFYNALGRPESPDDYDFQKPELPEGMPYDESREGKMRRVLHSLGINQKQAKGLWDALHEDGVDAWNEIQAQRKAAHDHAVNGLKEKWGDQYEERAERAYRAAVTLGNKVGEGRLEKWLDQSGFGDYPILVEIFDVIGSAISEDALGQIGSASGGEVADAADTLYPEMAKKAKAHSS